MFEWLDLELSLIKTPKFHIIEGPSKSKYLKYFLNSPIYFPESYKEFVLKYGESRLYRDGRISSKIGVFATPKKFNNPRGILCYKIGFFDDTSIWLKSPSVNCRFYIYEGDPYSFKIVDDDFEKWLKNRCDLAKMKLKRFWKNIILGPAPFNQAEKEMLETRKLIKWKVLGIDVEGNHLIQIQNAGKFRLPIFSLGVRSKNGRLNGGLHLKIGDLAPGQSTVLSTDCYKELVSPQEIEIFPLPDPQPEDREFYWEFKHISSGKDKG